MACTKMRRPCCVIARFDGTANGKRRPATCRASVARYGQPREKRSVRGEPAGYELSEEPHALRVACLPLCEKPERSVHVQIGARHPHQQGVGISDEARQCRDPEPLPYSNDLRLGVRGPSSSGRSLADRRWRSETRKLRRRRCDRSGTFHLGALTILTAP